MKHYYKENNMSYLHLHDCKESVIYIIVYLDYDCRCFEY